MLIFLHADGNLNKYLLVPDSCSASENFITSSIGIDGVSIRLISFVISDVSLLIVSSFTLCLPTFRIFHVIKMKAIGEVEKIIKDSLRKSEKELRDALIRPLSPEYPFSTNGVYFLIGKMGSGKSYMIWKHIMITERLFDKPFYSEIIFCSTSGSMDKTSDVFAKNAKTKIRYVKEDELMPLLERHLRRKSKYYSIAKHVLSRMRDTDEEMQRIIEKHGLEDLEDRICYIAEKLQKYGTSKYPYHTLLVLDDMAASPLLAKKDSPLVRIMTKTRHYNLTVMIVVQTIRFVSLNCKRLATDVVLFSKYSDEDFMAVLDQTPNHLNKKEALEEYKTLTGIHDYVQINITADSVRFVKESH